MAALQRAAAATEIASFLSCCEDIAQKGTQTLSVRAVQHRLGHLEEAWRALTLESNVSPSAQSQALQHYYDVYEACVQTVPLPLAVWDRWGVGLTSAFAAATTAAEASSSSSCASTCAAVEALRAELVMRYWGLFCRLFWGCSCSAKARLAFALEQAQASTASVALSLQQKEKEEDHPTHDASGEAASPATEHAPTTVESLEEALATPLHSFARLASDMSHLFGDYGVIGAMERQWLSEEVALQLDDAAAQTAVEALVRRSYKRDLQIPSAGLQALMQDCEENELDERRAKELLALGVKTSRGGWMAVATALHQHVSELAARQAAAEVSSQSSTLVYDDRAYELMDDLLKELRKMRHSRGCLPALGALTHRLVEWQPAPSSAAHHQPGLTSSQTQFYLFLLQQWFSQYIASQHRWSVTDAFNAPDDADLWSFVLDRHSVCLMWSLATLEGTSATPTSASSSTNAAPPAPSGCTPSQQQFMAMVDDRVDKLRAVFYSVAHCLHLYRAALAVFTNPEKRELRLATAGGAVQRWLEEKGSAVFCRGLLGDLLDTTEAWEDENMQTPLMQLWALRAEGELKLILYDTMAVVGCRNNAAERLETLVQVALDLCATWRTGLTEHDTTAFPVETTAVLFAPLIAFTVRVLHRLRVRLQAAFASAAPEPRSSDVESYTRMVGWLKQLLATGGAYCTSDELAGAYDELFMLLSMTMPTAADEHEGHSHGPVTAATIPALVSYATATRSGRGASVQASGGLSDLSWERRNQSKARRAAAEQLNVTAGQSYTQLAKAAEPVTKKPRVEETS